MEEKTGRCFDDFLSDLLLLIAVYTPSHAYTKELSDGKFIVFAIMEKDIV